MGLSTKPRTSFIGKNKVNARKKKVSVAKVDTIDRTGKVRKPFKEKSWQKAQAAPRAAAELMKTADPLKLAGQKGLAKLLRDATHIASMSLGKHGALRTPVPKLRQAIARLEANSRFLSDEGQALVQSATSGMLDHLGCVNTDKSFKPFAIVLVAVLQLAVMSANSK